MSEKISEILITVFKISESDSIKDLSMDKVPSWDSLTHMDLIVAIEDEFNIRLSGDDIADMLSFGAIRNTVKRALG